MDSNAESREITDSEGDDVAVHSEAADSEAVDTETADTETVDGETIARGLARIRKRRWLLWGVLIVYLPAMMTAQELAGSFRGALPAFLAWFAILLVVTGISATAKCPRCGNYFHVNGSTLLYLRRCLHCQLHLTADKKGSGR